MTSTKALKTLCGTIASALLIGLPSFASAHEGDVHHWFEHERARIEGGPLPLAEELSTSRPSSIRPSATSPARGDGDGATTNTKRRLTSALPDCLIENMKASEGYVPHPCTDRPTSESDQRWVVDEDKERGRHAGQGRTR